MSTFHCSNCKIDLTNDESMRIHYKSEFHRYNIKRHLVNLAPISHDQFSKKKSEILDARKSEKEVTLKCDTCKKVFSSRATHKQHMDSAKHKETLKNLPKEEEIVLDNNEEKKSKVRVTTMEDRSVCLFCNEKSTDVDENLVHMRLAHSFFISEVKYLKNLDGLLKYLSEKIHKGCLCITCENHHCKDFKSGIAVQNHMMDKGHCFMRTDDFDEYHKYYDFSKSLENMQNKMLLGNENEPLKENEAYLEMESGDEDDEDDEWEDDEESEEDDEDEEAEENEEDDDKNDKEIKKPRNRRRVERGGEDENQVQDGDDKEQASQKEEKKKRVYRFKVKQVKVLESGEIQLPNGKILGHRKYQYLYKQYFRESARKVYIKQQCLGDTEERAVARRAQEDRRIVLQNVYERKMKIKLEISHKQTKKDNRAFVRMGLRGNMLQPHFKNDNPL